METLKCLIFPVPSLLVPTPDTKGGGGGGGRPDLPAISKTPCSINLKCCRVLETSFHVLEMLKLLTAYLLSVYLVTIAPPQSRGVLSGKSLDFSRKYQYSNCYEIHNLKDNIIKRF